MFWQCLLVLGVANETGFTAPPQRPSHHPNIVLVTLDTTRADRMGFLGSKRGLTPTLDALAETAVAFSRAYAQVPLTTPSHAAILTGTYPQFNHVNYMGDPLGKDVPSLPEILRQSGYRTAAFVGALALEPNSVAPGFERGFDVYDAGFHRRMGQDRYQTLERRGEEVVRRALAWLSRKPAGPFFLWVHLYDAHDPYDPPEPFKTRFQKEPYDGEIAYEDYAVSKLVAGLRARGVFDSSLIAIMADHGEAFGEHGENHHGIFLYDETIRVPLLLRLPGQKASKRLDDRVGLVDVAPTILRELNLPIPAGMQGMPLGKLLRRADGGDKAEGDRAIYSESDYGQRSFGWSSVQSWRSGKYLYIEAPKRELYDEGADPGATRNVARDAKGVADTAAAMLADFYRKTKRKSDERARLGVEQTESLNALGYMAFDAGTSEKTAERGADPKDKIDIANSLYGALVHMEREEYREAIPILTEVLKQEPSTPIALLHLGRAHMALQEYGNAVAPLRTLVALKPDDGFARYEYGCALVKTGDWEEAAPQFEAAVSQLHNVGLMHFYLALVYDRNARNEDAVREFLSAVRLDPESFPPNLMLGRLLVKQQKAGDALSYLRKATRLRPDSIDAHRFLADAYQQLGRHESARQEAEKADNIRARGGTRLGTPGKPGTQR